jgi:hypothetical protein
MSTPKPAYTDRKPSRIRLHQFLDANNVSEDRFVRFEAVIIDPATQNVVTRIHLADLTRDQYVEFSIERTHHDKKDCKKCSA